MNTFETMSCGQHSLATGFEKMTLVVWNEVVGSLGHAVCVPGARR